MLSFQTLYDLGMKLPVEESMTCGSIPPDEVIEHASDSKNSAIQQNSRLLLGSRDIVS